MDHTVTFFAVRVCALCPVDNLSYSLACGTQVVSAIFDADQFNEEAASGWWLLNGHRFEDSGSLAQREEMVCITYK
jgi:hypothetical protein